MNRGRIGRRGIVLLVVALLVLSVVPGTVAAEPRVGGTVVVAEGDTVDGLQVVSGTVVVRGTVDGNLEAVGGSVVVAESGVVNGDLAVSAGSVQLDGTVEGSVEGAAGSFTLGESAVVEGTLDVGAGSAQLDGTVRGDATVGADRLTLGSTAVVGGDLTVDDGTELVREDGATVEGTLVRTDLGGVSSGLVGGSIDWALTVWGFAANLLLGTVLLLVFPRFSRRVVDGVADTPAVTGGVGLGVLVGGPLVLLLVAMTVVGIPLVLFVGVPVLVVGGWVALVYGRFAVAAVALERLGYDNRWVALVVGVVGLGLVALVPVLGGLVDLVVFLLGLGALALGLYRSYGGGRLTPPDRQTTTAADEDGSVSGPV